MISYPVVHSLPRFAILVIGHRGMLGQDLLACFEARGQTPVGLDVQEIDITLAVQVDGVLREHKPQLVINCAAYTAVDKAEVEPDLAFAVNRTGPENLAKGCKHLGIPLIHLSTDYIFDGKATRPYQEDDPAGPLSVYGRSKWAGEQSVRSLLPEHLIVRTAWLYGVRGNNFVKTMLRLARERDELRVVADQYGSPTWTGDLSDILVEMSLQVLSGSVTAPWGTYHCCNDGWTTWFEFARCIVDHAREMGEVKVQRMVPIASSEYPLPTPRPAYSILDCTKIARVFGINPRPWQVAFADMMKQLRSSEDL